MGGGNTIFCTLNQDYEVTDYQSLHRQSSLSHNGGYPNFTP